MTNDILGCMSEITGYDREVLLLKAFRKEFSLNDLTSIFRFVIEHRDEKAKVLWHNLITIYPRGRKAPSHTIEKSGDHGWQGAMAEALVNVHRLCKEGVDIGKVVVETWKGKSKII